MEEIIRRAKEEDIPSLRGIWAECFPLDTEYADFFFERIFRLSSAVVCETGGECVAMIHVFPRVLSTPKGELSAKYIYGVGTLEKFRGRGIAGRMLQSEEKDCDALLLIPQSESLFEFYKKYGFSELSNVKRFSEKPKGKAEIFRAGEDDIAHLNSIYEGMLSGKVFARRDYKTWKLLIDEYNFLGGGFAVWRDGYCAYYEHCGKLAIAEFFSKETSPASVAGAFGRECEITAFGGETPLAVIKPLGENAESAIGKENARYINLMHN